MNVTSLLYHLSQSQKNQLLADIITDATGCPETKDLALGVPFPSDFAEHFTDRLENALSIAQRNRSKAEMEPLTQ